MAGAALSFARPASSTFPDLPWRHASCSIATMQENLSSRRRRWTIFELLVCVHWKLLQLVSILRGHCTQQLALSIAAGGYETLSSGNSCTDPPTLHSHFAIYQKWDDTYNFIFVHSTCHFDRWPGESSTIETLSAQVTPSSAQPGKGTQQQPWPRRAHNE